MSLDGFQSLLLDDLRRLRDRVASRRGVDIAGSISPDTLALMMGDAWMLGKATVLSDLTEARACRICGCTDHAACDPPCSWVAKDLCSACDVVGS